MNSQTIGTICITVVVFSLIVATAIFNINDRKLMAQNITEAISKGMDPLSVRCSYSSAQDVTCVAYASKK